MNFPRDEQIIEAVELVQKETGKGTDAINSDETLSALVRSKLPAEFATVSTTKLMGRAVSLRKAGSIEGAGTGSGPRSEADLEAEGAKQQGVERREAADVYRWTKTEQYKTTVRAEVLARDGNRCQFCYSTTRLQSHHRSYVRCRQSGEVDDCITLCQCCHGALHSHWDKRKCGKPSPLQTELNELRQRDDHAEFI